MGEVADLFATLGLHVNESEWSSGDKAIDNTRKQLLRYEAAQTRQRDRNKAAASRAVASLERDSERENQQRERTLQRSAAGVARWRKRNQADHERATQKTKAISDRAAQEDQQRFEHTAQTAGLIGLSLAGVATYMAGRVVKSGVELNSTLEDAKDKVAGMLALANHSDFNKELENSTVLMRNLEQAAAKLPGETSDYVNMLSLIAQPVSQAKLGLKELEKLTISATSTALTMHMDPGQAARDIEGALNGVFNSRDRFTGPLLAARGFSGEEGRSRFNAMDAKKRASEVMAAFTAPQLTAMAAAQGKSFSGMLATTTDAWHQFERTITKPLFESLEAGIAGLNQWLDANKEKIAALTEEIGVVLKGAFLVAVKSFEFLIEHGDAVIAVIAGLTAAFIAFGIVASAAWLAALGPVFIAAAAIAALVYAFQKLAKHADVIKQAFRDAWDAIKRGAEAAFDAIIDLPGVRLLVRLMKWIDSRHGGDTDSGGGNPAHAGMTQDQLDNLPSNQLNYVEQMGRLSSPDRSIPGRDGPVSVNVDVGGINVNAPNSDPAAVADLVGKHFDDKMGNMLRRSMDAVS